MILSSPWFFLIFCVFIIGKVTPLNNRVNTHSSPSGRPRVEVPVNEHQNVARPMQERPAGDQLADPNHPGNQGIRREFNFEVHDDSSSSASSDSESSVDFGDSGSEDSGMDLAIDGNSNRPPSPDNIQNIFRLPVIVHNRPNENSLSANSLMIELAPGSGVLMNRHDLENLVRLYRNRPSKLQRQIFEKLIGREELAKMSSSPTISFRAIPENVRKAVEAFLDREALPIQTSREFKRNLHNHLLFLRRKYNFIELVPGTGVKIIGRKFERFILEDATNPSTLQRRLFEELIPPRKLALMKVAGGNRNSRVPKHIRETVEIFVNSIASPKLTHEEFLKNLATHIKQLKRRIYSTNVPQ